MLMLSICKLVMDLLLFFIVAGLFFAGTISLRLIVLTLVGCALGYGLRKIHIVFLGLGVLPMIEMLPGFGVTFDVWKIMVGLLPFAYTVYLSRKDAVQEYLGDLSSHFMIYLTGAACVTAVGQIYGHPAYDFILLFLYAVLGIFTLQIFRLYQGGGLTVRHTGLFGLILTGMCGIVLLAASPVIWKTVGNIVQWIYIRMIVPLLEWILRGVFFLLELLFRLILWVMDLLHLKADTFITEAPVAINADAAQDFLTKNVTPEKSFFLTIISVLVFVGLSLLLFRMLRGRRLPVSQSFVHSDEEAISYVKKEKLPHGNIGEIRKRYRRMLLKMKKQGAKIDLTSTTEDVAHEGLAFYSVEENTKIKDEYRKARYFIKK